MKQNPIFLFLVIITVVSFLGIYGTKYYYQHLDDSPILIKAYQKISEDTWIEFRMNETVKLIESKGNEISRGNYQISDSIIVLNGEIEFALGCNRLKFDESKKKIYLLDKYDKEFRLIKPFKIIVNNLKK